RVALGPSENRLFGRSMSAMFRRSPHLPWGDAVHVTEADGARCVRSRHCPRPLFSGSWAGTFTYIMKELSMQIQRTAGWSLSRRLSLGRLAALAAAVCLAFPVRAFASELDLQIPALDTTYSVFGTPISGVSLLLLGLGVCVLGMAFGMTMFNQVK